MSYSSPSCKERLSTYLTRRKINLSSTGATSFGLPSRAQSGKNKKGKNNGGYVAESSTRESDWLENLGKVDGDDGVLRHLISVLEENPEYCSAVESRNVTSSARLASTLVLLHLASGSALLPFSRCPVPKRSGVESSYDASFPPAAPTTERGAPLPSSSSSHPEGVIPRTAGDGRSQAPRGAAPPGKAHHDADSSHPCSTVAFSLEQRGSHTPYPTVMTHHRMTTVALASTAALYGDAGAAYACADVEFVGAAGRLSPAVCTANTAAAAAAVPLKTCLPYAYLSAEARGQKGSAGDWALLFPDEAASGNGSAAPAEVLIVSAGLAQADRQTDGHVQRRPAASGGDGVVDVSRSGTGLVEVLVPSEGCRLKVPPGSLAQVPVSAISADPELVSAAAAAATYQALLDLLEDQDQKNPAAAGAATFEIPDLNAAVPTLEEYAKSRDAQKGIVGAPGASDGSTHSRFGSEIACVGDKNRRRDDPTENRPTTYPRFSNDDPPRLPLPQMDTTVLPTTTVLSEAPAAVLPGPAQKLRVVSPGRKGLEKLLPAKVSHLSSRGMTRFRDHIRSMKKDIMNFEETIPWTCVSTAWRAKRAAWRRALKNVETAAAAAAASSGFVNRQLSPPRSRSSAAEAGNAGKVPGAATYTSTTTTTTMTKSSIGTPDWPVLRTFTSQPVGSTVASGTDSGFESPLRTGDSTIETSAIVTKMVSVLGNAVLDLHLALRTDKSAGLFASSGLWEARVRELSGGGNNVQCLQQVLDEMKRGVRSWMKTHGTLKNSNRNGNGKSGVASPGANSPTSASPLKAAGQGSPTKHLLPPRRVVVCPPSSSAPSPPGAIGSRCPSASPSCLLAAEPPLLTPFSSPSIPTISPASPDVLRQLSPSSAKEEGASVLRPSEGNLFGACRQALGERLARLSSVGRGESMDPWDLSLPSMSVSSASPPVGTGPGGAASGGEPPPLRSGASIGIGFIHSGKLPGGASVEGEAAGPTAVVVTNRSDQSLSSSGLLFSHSRAAPSRSGSSENVISACSKIRSLGGRWFSGRDGTWKVGAGREGSLRESLTTTGRGLGGGSNSNSNAGVSLLLACRAFSALEEAGASGSRLAEQVPISKILMGDPEAAEILNLMLTWPNGAGQQRNPFLRRRGRGREPGTTMYALNSGPAAFPAQERARDTGETFSGFSVLHSRGSLNLSKSKEALLVALRPSGKGEGTGEGEGEGEPSRARSVSLGTPLCSRKRGRNDDSHSHFHPHDERVDRNGRWHGEQASGPSVPLPTGEPTKVRSAALSGGIPPPPSPADRMAMTMAINDDHRGKYRRATHLSYSEEYEFEEPRRDASGMTDGQQPVAISLNFSSHHQEADPRGAKRVGNSVFNGSRFRATPPEEAATNALSRQFNNAGIRSEDEAVNKTNVMVLRSRAASSASLRGMSPFFPSYCVGAAAGAAAGAVFRTGTSTDGQVPLDAPAPMGTPVERRSLSNSTADRVLVYPRLYPGPQATAPPGDFDFDFGLVTVDPSKSKKMSTLNDTNVDAAHQVTLKPILGGKPEEGHPGFHSGIDINGTVQQGTIRAVSELSTTCGMSHAHAVAANQEGGFSGIFSGRGSFTRQPGEVLHSSAGDVTGRPKVIVASSLSDASVSRRSAEDPGPGCPTTTGLRSGGDSLCDEASEEEWGEMSEDGANLESDPDETDLEDLFLSNLESSPSRRGNKTRRVPLYPHYALSRPLAATTTTVLAGFQASR